MECLQQNGDITGYIVRYSPLNQDLIPTDTILVNVSADGDRELTLTGLLLLTPYQIEVAVFNDQGPGRFYNSRTGYLILENGTIGETTLNGSKFYYACYSCCPSYLLLVADLDACQLACIKSCW